MPPVDEHSSPSHRHYFASIREVWVNLPDSAQQREDVDLRCLRVKLRYAETGLT